MDHGPLMALGLAMTCGPVWMWFQEAHPIQGRLQVFRVGGMRFIKFRYWGNWKICISFCLTQK